jgi:hypothetical protein
MWQILKCYAVCRAIVEELYDMRMRSYVTACCRIHFSLAVMFLFIEQFYILEDSVSFILISCSFVYLLLVKI